MKIFISADLEGINGVVSPDDINENGSGYKAACKRMTEETNAIIEGLFIGGATEITVCDSHNVAHNINIEDLDNRVLLLRGDTRKDSMVHSIDSSYDGLVLLGYHAKFGTANAILDHSFNPKAIRDIQIDGVSYGELGVNALFAASKGVPLILVTGDSAVKDEAKRFSANVETVVVKYPEGRFSARCLPISKTQQMLKDAAKQAISQIEKYNPVYVSSPLELRIIFQQVNLADGAMRVNGTKRIDAFTVAIYCDSMDDLMAKRQVIFNAALGFYDSSF